MNITDYRLHRVHLPLREPIGDSQVRFTDHWITVVELHCDNGLRGIGFECQQGLPTARLVSLQEEFEYTIWPSLKQAEPLGLAMRVERPRGGNVGPGFKTVPVETALWDLVAKQAGLPLYEFLGGTNPKVRAYGSTLDFRLDDNLFRTKLERMQRYGFSAFKVKVGHPDIAWDLRRLQLVRDVVGCEVDLMIDANEGYNATTAIRLGRELADLDLVWFEEPVNAQDLDAYLEVKAALPMAIAGGENLRTRYEFKPYLTQRAYDIVQPDIMHCGGITEMARICAMANACGIQVNPHVWGSPVMIAATLHLAATLPPCPPDLKCTP